MLEEETHGSWFSTSRGKHSNSLKFLHTAIFPFSPTYAERRSRTTSSPPPSTFSPNHLLEFSLFPSAYFFVFYIFSVFSASSSRRNVTTFAKAFDLDAGGWRRGRRIRIKRTNCRKLVESPRQNPRPSLLYPSVTASRAPQCFPPEVASRIPSCSASPIPHSFTDFSRVITRRWHKIISQCNLKDCRKSREKRNHNVRTMQD